MGDRIESYGVLGLGEKGEGEGRGEGEREKIIGVIVGRIEINAGKMLGISKGLVQSFGKRDNRDC